MSIYPSKSLFKNIIFVLCAIFLLNALFMFTHTNSARLVLVILVFCVLAFERKEYMIPSLFFIHSCSASFDTAGFTYLFNISIVIVAVRIIIYRNLKANKKILSCLILILIQELLMDAVYGKLNSSILSLAGWISGYLIIAFESRFLDGEDFDRIVKYLFWGYVVGFIQGMSIPILRWGLSWPTAFRFTGMLRDPNYYSLNAILLINSAYLLEKRTKINRFFIIIPTLVMGFFSVSKMFLGLAFVSIALQELLVLKKINVKKIAVTSIVLLAFIMVSMKYGLIDMFMTKFVYRFDTVSLTTGRNVLFSHYVNQLTNNPLYLIFGVGMLGYHKVLNSVEILGGQFGRYVAHNTYLDVICSWGLIGILVYSVLLIYINHSTNTYNHERHDRSFYIVVIVFAAGIFSLSYLGADVFALLVLFIFIFKKASVIDCKNRT